MNLIKIFLILINWTIAPICSNDQNHSFTFNGTSYIRNIFKRKAFSSSESLLIEFQTRQTDGHLFYAGSRDYGINVSFRNGILRISLRLRLITTVGSVSQLNPQQLLSNNTYGDQPKIDLAVESIDEFYPFTLNDNQWHVVEYQRFSQTIQIQLDSQVIYEKELEIQKNTLSNLEYEQIILGNTFTPDNPSHQGSHSSNLFTGKMSQAIFQLDGGQINILEYASSSKHNFKIENDNRVRNLYPPRSSLVGVTFLSESLSIAFLKLRLPRYYDNEEDQSKLSIDFMSNEYHSGLLFHLSWGHIQTYPDERFIAMEFERGSLILVYKCDQNRTTERFPIARMLPERNIVQVDVNNESFLRITLNSNEVYNEKILEAKYVSLTRLFGNDLFVGGMNFLAEMAMSRVDPLLLSVTSRKKNFIGSIQRVSFNNHDLDIESAFRSKNSADVSIIKLGSDAEINNSCNRQLSDNALPVCLNGGHCENGFNRPLCRCDKRFTTGAICETRYRTYVLSGYMSINYPVKQKSVVDTLEISFQTIQPNGVLFQTFEKSQIDDLNDKPSQSDDSLSVFLRDGRIFVKFQLSNQISALKLTPTVHDGNWHYMNLTREWDQVVINLDDHPFYMTIADLNHYELITGSLSVLEEVSDKAKELPFEYTQLMVGKAVLTMENMTMEKISKVRGFVGNIRLFCFNGLCPFEEGSSRSLLSSSSDSTELSLKRNKRAWSTYTYSIQVSPDDGSGVEPKVPPTYPISFSSADCYLQSQSMNLYDKFVFQFSFKTTQPNGLILYNEAISGSDFIAFELTNGQIQMIYNMGRGIDWLKIDSPSLADKKWHQIILSRNDVVRNVLRLEIDPNTSKGFKKEILVKGGEHAKNFDLKGPLFLGGAPKEKFTIDRERFTSPFGFHGCLGNFSFNNGQTAEDVLELVHEKSQSFLNLSPLKDQEIRLDIENQAKKTTTSYQCVQTGCDETVIDSEARSCYKKNDFCHNGGECLHHWNEIKCFCEMTTFSGQRCGKAGTTIQLTNSKVTSAPKSFIEFTFRDRQSSSRDEIAIGFQLDATGQDSGKNTELDMNTLKFIQSRKFSNLFKEFHSIQTLLTITSEKNEDYIHVILINGILVVEYDMGGGPIARAAFDQVLDDGYYHRVLLHRNGPQMLVIVDNSTFSIMSENKAVQFNNQNSISIGHYPSTNIEDYFSGHISGIYVNGLQIFDHIPVSKFNKYFIVTKHNIHLIKDFRPKIKNNSIFTLIDTASSDDLFSFPNDNASKNQTHVKLQNFRLQGDAQFTKTKEILTSLDIVGKLDTKFEHNNLWNFSKFNDIFALVSQDINTWLIVILSVTGILLITSIIYLMYKCQMKTRSKKYSLAPQVNDDVVVLDRKNDEMNSEDNISIMHSVREGICLNDTSNSYISGSILGQPGYSSVFPPDNWVYQTHDNENILIASESFKTNQSQTFIPTGYYLQR